MACKRKKAQSKVVVNKEVISKIVDFLKSVEMARPGDIAEKTGLDKKVVSEAIKELKKEGKIISPKRCYYALNKE